MRPTARWCFDRLASPAGEESWLHHHREVWEASGRDWDAYLAAWADDEGLHAGKDIVASLQGRFDTRLLTRTPYFFPDLGDITEATEQAAIDAGDIKATGIRYVGRLASDP